MSARLSVLSVGRSACLPCHRRTVPLKPIDCCNRTLNFDRFCCVSAHYHHGHDRRTLRSFSTYCARISPTCGRRSLRGTRTSWCVCRRRASSVADSWSAVDSLLQSSIHRLYIFLVRCSISIHRLNFSIIPINR